MRFYPRDVLVPEELRTEEFVLRPLRATDVERDYAALMDSKESLRMWSGSEWPADGFTLAENLRDLEEHEQEHVEGTAFTYTVLDPTGSECLGCVYILPLAPRFEPEVTLPHSGADPRARVAFWVRTPRLADGLEGRLLAELIEWFRREWRFTQVVFFTREANSRQVQLFDRSGLQRLYTKEFVDEATGQSDRYVVYD